MIYAEWLINGEFNNAFFTGWNEYHAATFSPEIEILFVKEIKK